MSALSSHSETITVDLQNQDIKMPCGHGNRVKAMILISAAHKKHHWQREDTDERMAVIYV